MKKDETAEQQPALAKPADLKNTPVDFEHGFGAAFLNKVMLNRFDVCCYHLDPSKHCQAQAASEAKHAELVWLKFSDTFNISELSAATLAEMFKDFGDFQLLKDAPQSCILNFSKFDKGACDPHSASPAGFVTLMGQQLEKFHLQTVCSYEKAPKFVAHDHLSE